MFRNRKLMSGISSILVALMVFSIFATLILFRYSSTINAHFGISTTLSDDFENGIEHYRSDYGDINPDNLTRLEADAESQTVKEAEEGTVLLKNKDMGAGKCLPLSRGDRISLFGRACYSPLYRTSAACTRVVTANPDRVVSLYKSLSDAGFNLNQELFNSYSSGSGVEKAGFSLQFEETRSFYESKTHTLEGYRDIAIIMLSRSAGEGTDMSTDQSKIRLTMNNPDYKPDEEKNSLALQKNEKDMIRFVKNQGFSKIIALINTNYQMELGWIDSEEFGVDAALYISTPGLTGFDGVASILNGDINPSGRLVDTFASNSLSSPAIVNACGNTQQWANVDDYRNDGIVKDVKNQTSFVTVQQENIYIGYRYYETRYEDCILGNGGASSAVGSTDGNAWNYSLEVTYPFGYGLSYSEFSQEILSVEYDHDLDRYKVDVKVTNNGNTKGRFSVVLYAQTPFGNYEKSRNIEKSSIQLVAFDKTALLEKDATETLSLYVDRYFLASYDMTGDGGYVISEGDYYFAVGGNVHDALNNILASKNAAGLYDQEGKPCDGDLSSVYKTSLDLDITSYEYGEGGKEKGIPVKNQFEKMDINYWDGNDVTYLSRKNWADTFPIQPANAYCSTSEMKYLLQGEFYSKENDGESTAYYAQGKHNGWEGISNNLSFESMKDIPYDDSEVWNRFIDQFSLNDLAVMAGSYFGNEAIIGKDNSVSLPKMSGGDGCQGVGDEPYDDKLTGGKNLWPCLFTSALVCTFNKDLMMERGRLMANQALFLKQAVIWTGGGNLHRTPYGGRQAEYYSECPNLCYLTGLYELPEMEKRGVLAGYKHFVANDQETQREGLNTFYTEQALREGALRAFEGAVRKGRIKAIMGSFNRQGVVYSSSCYELNITVLRKEWNFQGQVITDASSGATTGYKSHYTTSIVNGTDIYCLDGAAVGGKIIAKYIQDNDDGYLLSCLRDAAFHKAFALSRSCAINNNTRFRIIMPAWQIATITVAVVFSVLAVISCSIYFVGIYLNVKKGGKS